MSATETLSFSPYEVPESGDPLVNRFPEGRTPGGFTAPADEAYSNLAWNLMLDRQRTQPEILPEFKDIPLFKIVIENGAYVLRERPSVRAVPSRQATRSTKIPSGKFTKVGPELLNAVLLGEDGYDQVLDKDLWESARITAEQLQARGRTLRRLSDAVALLVLIRQGILAKDNLPWE